MTTAVCAERPSGASGRVLALAALAAATIALVLGALLAPSAQARDSWGLTGSYDFGGGFGAGGTASMAVHEGDELLYILDQANNRILKFDISDPDNPVPANFAATGTNAIESAAPGDPGEFTLAERAQIQVDDSGGPQDGTIYLSEGYTGFVPPAGTNGFAFGPDGAFGYMLPDLDGNPVQSEGIAVVDTGDDAGHLLVLGGVPPNKMLVLYEPSETPGQPPVPVWGARTFISGTERIDVSSDGSAFHVATGGFIAQITDFSTLTGAQLFRRNATPPSWSTVADTTLGPGPEQFFTRSASNLGVVALDPEATGAIGETTLARDTFAAGAPGTGKGMIFYPAAERLYVWDQAGSEIDIYGPGSAPDVEIELPGFVDATTAELRAQVDALGLTVTDCRFETGTTPSVLSMVTPCTVSPAGEVSANLSPVVAGQTYHTRIVVQAGAFQATSGTVEWVAPNLPEAVTLPSGPVNGGAGTAVLGGTVDANGTPTRFYVEYSTASDLSGSSVYPEARDADAGSGTDPVRVSQVVPGLDPETTYYFRLVAATGAGESAGQVFSFTTLPAPEPDPESCPNEQFRTGHSARLPGCMAYEKVSRDTNGGDIWSGGSVASTDGDAVTFYSGVAFAGAVSQGVVGEYLARRTADGWNTEAISPPSYPGPPPEMSWVYDYASPDLDLLAGSGLNVRLPGLPRENQTAYKRSADGSIEEIGRRRPGVPLPIGRGEVIGISDDGETIAVGTAILEVDSGPSVPSSFSFGAYNLYYWTDPDDGMGVASLFPDGELALATKGKLSRDGSKIVWQTDATPATHGGGLEVFVREKGEVAQRASAPQGVPATADPVFYVGATDDLRYVFFTSAGKLTPDATAVPGRADLYRFDTETGTLEDLTTADPNGGGAGTRALLDVSDDGQRVYFAASGNLAPGASGSGVKLYLREGSETRLVAELATVASYDYSLNDRAYGKTNQTTSDGRYLIFADTREDTVHDPDGHLMYYRYDAVEDRLDCVTCDTRGRSATANAYLTPPKRTGVESPKRKGERPRVFADGSVLFASADSLVPGDTNGTWDTYLWDDGEHRLLSSGTSEDGEWFEATTADRSSVFIYSRKHLVPADNDEVSDLYVAREGGGLASQQQRPVAPAPPCKGEECQGGVTPAPSGPGIDTGSVREGNAAPGCAVVVRRASGARRRAVAARKRVVAARRGVVRRRAAVRRADGADRQTAARRLKVAKRRLRANRQRLRKAVKTRNQAVQRSNRCLRGADR